MRQRDKCRIEKTVTDKNWAIRMMQGIERNIRGQCGSKKTKQHRVQLSRKRK